MPRFRVSNAATIHTARSFLQSECPFDDDGGEAVLELHPEWAYLEPVALAMIAAWGAHWRGVGRSVRVENLGVHAADAAGMGLFQHLGVDLETGSSEPLRSGRLPLARVKTRADVAAVLERISEQLGLDDDPESLAAVRYCTSELIRNVLEHAGSPDGAFVCARRYQKRPPYRVTLAVVDCGRGIGEHLGRVHPEAAEDDLVALGLAMRPGVTGAVAGMYGTPDNAGAGLFITRSIAKGTGGYFLLVSGHGAYRLRRTASDEGQMTLLLDAFDEERFDRWRLPCEWPGTAVSLEIRTDRIGDYDGFFEWIFRRVPPRERTGRRIRFT
jgi:anti-sigma regulatory factor (Ser/Thr protein kinase)